MKNFTPEEITAMHHRNENFVGTHADFSKIQRYQTLKSLLVDFLHQCPYVIQLEELPPTPDRISASLILDIKPLSMIGPEEITLFHQISSLADRIVVAVPEEKAIRDRIRISFLVAHVWAD
jgi:hypothetical protein